MSIPFSGSREASRYLEKLLLCEEVAQDEILFNKIESVYNYILALRSNR